MFGLLGSARQHLAVRTLVQGAGWDRGQTRAEMVEPQQVAARVGSLPGHLGKCIGKTGQRLGASSPPGIWVEFWAGKQNASSKFL